MGRPAGVAGIAVAVEERVGAQRGTELMGRFATAIVHDFRNSLGAIGGYASLLERELAGAPELQSWASEIVRASDRAADFTSRLIAFNRGSAWSPRRLDLRTSVEDFARVFGPLPARGSRSGSSGPTGRWRSS